MLPIRRAAQTYQTWRIWLDSTIGGRPLERQGEDGGDDRESDRRR